MPCDIIASSIYIDECSAEDPRVDLECRGRRSGVTRFEFFSLSGRTQVERKTDTFLQINDQINTVINRYEAFKKGDYAAASNPIPSELSSRGQGQNDLSLIDFDDSASNTASSQQAAGGAASGIDELASLFGPSATATVAPAQPQQQPLAGLGAQPQQQPLHSLFSSPQQNTGFVPGGMMNAHMNPVQRALSPQHSGSQAGTPVTGSIRLPGTPQAQTARLGSPTSHYFPQTGGPTSNVGMSGGMMGSGMSAGMGMNGMSTAAFGTQPMQPTQPQQQPPAATNNAASGQTQGKDPFADLVGLF